MTDPTAPLTPERLTELAQYNRLGRARSFSVLLVPPTVEELDEVFALALAALDRERAAPSLDVERLARALVKWGGPLHAEGILPLDDEGRVAARSIAAEYARLEATDD